MRRIDWFIFALAKVDSDSENGMGVFYIHSVSIKASYSGIDVSERIRCLKKIIISLVYRFFDLVIILGAKRRAS